jgi:hypothetical protein
MKAGIIRTIKKYHAPLIGLGILIIIYIATSIDRYPLHRYGIYSVATVTDISKYHKGGRDCSFYFFYRGKIYRNQSTTRILLPGRDTGRRFYVKFLKDNPSRSYILDEKPVPDCIKEPPPEGWQVIPHCMDGNGKIY